MFLGSSIEIGFSSIKETVTSRLRVKTQLHSEQINKAFERFESVERKVDEIEAKVESYDLGKAPSLQQQFEELEKNEAIDKKLLRYLTVKVKDFDLETNYFAKREDGEKFEKKDKKFN